MEKKLIKIIKVSKKFVKQKSEKKIKFKHMNDRI